MEIREKNGYKGRRGTLLKISFRLRSFDSDSGICVVWFSNQKGLLNQKVNELFWFWIWNYLKKEVCC